jgi:hypothetical protein
MYIAIIMTLAGLAWFAAGQRRRRGLPGALRSRGRQGRRGGRKPGEQRGGRGRRQLPFRRVTICPCGDGKVSQ